MEFRKKRHIRRVFFSRGMIIILLVLVVVTGRAAWGVFQKERDSQRALDKTQAEALKLRERKSFLENDISDLNTPEGLEEEIRTTFGYGKSGERVLVVVPNTAATATKNSLEKGLWGWLKGLFE